MKPQQATNHNQPAQLSVSQNSALGSICRSICTLTSLPVVYWKNCLQQNIPVSFRPRVMFRGVGPGLFNCATTGGVQFSLVEACKQALCRLTGSPDAESPFCTLTGAFFGGFASGLWAGPIHLALIQQQRFGMSLFRCLYKLVCGFKLGLFRGTLSTCFMGGRLRESDSLEQSRLTVRLLHVWVPGSGSGRDSACGQGAGAGPIPSDAGLLGSGGVPIGADIAAV